MCVCANVRVSMYVVHTCYCASSMRVEIREQLWESGVKSRTLHSNIGCATELHRIACAECCNGSLNYSSRATPGIRWNDLHFSAEETEAFLQQSVAEEREF